VDNTTKDITAKGKSELEVAEFFDG